MKHKVLATLGAVISALGITVASATPGLAKPLEHDHFVDSGSEIVQDVDPAFCAGVVDFPVLHEWHAEGNFLVVQRGGGLAYGGNRFRSTDVWTNTLNGKTLTVTAVGNDRDQRVTDNGDGTLTIEAAVSGHQKVYGPDGARLFMDTGILRFEILINHGGTPADPFDDKFITDLGAPVAHGQTDTLERDFCEDLVTFIG